MVGGSTTILLIPANVPPLTPAPWQSAHALGMLAWLNSEFANFAPLGTGVAAMLEPAPTWQLSHPFVPYGTWLLGSPTIVMLAVL